MEEILIKPGHDFMPNKTPSPLAMHSNSHVISKLKPKIRIVHIFAPEVIKTDVENFRELVQRLTGKPAERKTVTKNNKKVNLMRSTAIRAVTKKKKTVELGDHHHVCRNAGYGTERIKDEEEELGGMWGGENNLSGFFGGFGDLERFIQGFGEFPLISANASHVDLFGDMLLSQ
ncbi:hypothetical protein Scep_013842 [Stephania cephalantha]|uniref:VQ domain-containing protein n=1 Tax=Stephania cephalantha TaxID=152367 RepID=A0AAP0J2N6_9MAGN